MDQLLSKVYSTKISQAYPKSWKASNSLSMKEKYYFNINLELNSMLNRVVSSLWSNNITGINLFIIQYNYTVT